MFTRIDDTRFTLIEEMLKCLEYKRYVSNKRIKLKSERRDCQIDGTPTSILRGTYYERCGKEIQETQKNLEAGTVPIYRSEDLTNDLYCFKLDQYNYRNVNDIFNYFINIHRKCTKDLRAFSLANITEI